MAAYATLSHRWGSSVPITTTTSTFEDRKKGITFSDLPKTFQDAVTITRNMGLKYLWIDSLCILQDSNLDWHSEAEKMGTYYWNAEFNIAAEDASDCTKGCFRERHPTSLGPCQVDIKFPVGFRSKSMTIEVSPILVLDWRVPVGSYLDSWGWLLQERILARQTLSYGHFQLSYSCMTGISSELKPLGESRGQASNRVQLFQELQAVLRCPPRDMNYGNIFRGIGYDYSLSNWEARRSWTPRTRDEFLPYLHWHKLVQAYMKCDLTNLYDILPALSGVA